MSKSLKQSGEQTGQKEGVGAAIGRIPSGVFIITAQDGSRKVGLLASWVQQVGFEPPTISVAIHPEREIYGMIEQTGCFAVNILSNENMTLMRNFSRYSPEQFDDLDAETTAYGIILKDAVANLQCKVLRKVEAADHHLFLAEVVEGAIMEESLNPMTHLRKSGFTY